MTGPPENPTDADVHNLRDELFRDFNNHANPLLAGAEAAFGAFPEGILNESRALLAHSARSYRDDFDSAERCRTLGRARTHLVRIQLDCHKLMYLAAEGDIEDFFDEYAAVSLGLVDNGQFSPVLATMRRDARAKVTDAKLAENSDGTAEKIPTLTEWASASEAYEDILVFIASKADALAHAATNYRQRRKRELISGLLVGVVSTLIGGWLLTRWPWFMALFDTASSAAKSG